MADSRGTKQPKHFKLHCSIQNHAKTAAMAADNDLLALYVRLGMLAIERFADRTDNTFIVSDRELPRLTGKYRADVARTLLERLAHVSPTCATRDGDVWRITIPNLAKKQGFGKRLNSFAISPSSSSSTPTSTKEEDMERAPSAPPAPRATRARRPSRKTHCPDHLEPDQRDSIRQWAAENDIDPASLKAEWEAMKDHWRGRDETRADWPATFRTWLRNSKRFAARDQAQAGESKAQARERRTREAAAEAFRRMTGHNDEQPTLLALPGGRA